MVVLDVWDKKIKSIAEKKEEKIYRKYDYLHIIIFIFWSTVFYLILEPSDIFSFLRIFFLSLICWMPTAATIFGFLINSSELKAFGIGSTIIYIIYFINNFSIL